LPLYSEQQLQEGLQIYRENLESGCWDLVFNGKELTFANRKGVWRQKGGAVRWEKRAELKKKTLLERKSYNGRILLTGAEIVS
jgi:hypothetical protein